MTVISIYSLSK